MRVQDRNWMQIERYLEQDDRIVVPLGSIEQHGYLSLGVDMILSERVSGEAAEPLGEGEEGRRGDEQEAGQQAPRAPDPLRKVIQP